MNPLDNTVQDNSTARQAVDQTSSSNDDLARALASVQAGPQDNLDFEIVGEPGLSGVPAMPAAQTRQAPVAPAAPVVTDDNQADWVEPTPMAAPPTVATAHASLPPAYSTPKVKIDHSSDDDSADDDSIEQIKLNALKQLRPLMQHIDLTPEERFEKYLMMLRASDDSSLIEPTYRAAEQITSEKLKAQALLDVINEINYLSSQELVAA